MLETTNRQNSVEIVGAVGLVLQVPQHKIS